jgi:hypothetical protein
MGQKKPEKPDNRCDVRLRAFSDEFDTAIKKFHKKYFGTNFNSF